MKKIQFLFIIIGTTIIRPANAVYKCANFDTSTTFSTTSVAGAADWTANKTYSGNIILSVRGIAICGGQAGSSMGTESDSVSIDQTSTNNKYCWCRMVSPAVSRWLYISTFASAGVCSNNCAQTCAQNMANPSGYRNDYRYLTD